MFKWIILLHFIFLNVINIKAQEIRIYWGNPGLDQIKKVDPNNTSVIDLILNSNNPAGIAIDTRNNKLIWANGGKISRANRDGTSVENIITGAGIPRGLAIDFVEEKLYWTDSFTDEVKKSDLNGLNAQVLISGLSDPFGITIDQVRRKLYWIDSGSGMVKRADLDGTNVEILHNDPTKLLKGITINVFEEKIYWSDIINNKIFQSDLNGLNVTELINTGLGNPEFMEFDLVNQKLYWSDSESSRLARSDKNGDFIETVVFDAILGFNISDLDTPKIQLVENKYPLKSVTNSDSVIYRITFSEPVLRTDVSDFTVTGITGGVISEINSVVSNLVYDVVIKGIINEGTVDLGASAQNVIDFKGNNWDGQINHSEFFRIDLTPPDIVAKNLTVNISSNITATINPIDLDNGTSDNVDLLSELTFSLNDSIFDCSELGDNTVKLSVTDRAGNKSSVDVTITVLDTTKLVTEDVTVFLNENGSGSIDLADVDGGSYIGCSTERNLDLSENTFDCPDIGSKTIQLSVLEGSVLLKSADVQVYVKDTIRPALRIKPLTLNLNQNGMVSIDSSQIDDGSSDNCSISSLSLSKSSFNCEDIGDQFVKVTAMDLSGNVSVDSVIVTVTEFLAPVVKTKDFILQLNNEGTGTLTISDIDNGSWDNCGIKELTLDKTNFNCADAGDQNVTLTAEDIHGNISESIAKVTVIAFESCITGIGDKEIENLFSVYPNPVTDGVIRLRSEYFKNHNADISIYNPQGDLVVSKHTRGVRNELLSIRLPEVSPGIYYLFLRSEDHNVIKKIFLE